MTTLGEAYIAVKADMRPFTRDLKKEVEKVVKDAEGNLSKGLTESLSKGAHEAGGKASDEFSDEFEKKTKKRFGNKNEKKPWMISVAAALAGALDDGISALPMQAKAAIVGGILLALPLISGALATAVSGAIGAGVAGLGILLAFQFEEVQTKAIGIFTDLREFLAKVAQPFVAETLAGLDRIGLAFMDWGPQLRRIFAIGADFVEPLERGILGALDKFIGSISKIAPKLLPFVDELSDGFEIISESLGDFLEILASTGEDGQVAFRDLIHLTSDFIINLAYLIKALAEVYGWVRKISLAVPYLSPLAMWFNASDQAAASAGQYGASLDDLTYQIDGTVTATKAQEKALKDAAKAMDTVRDAAFKLIDANINYEEALDRLDESLEKNGKTLDITGDKGRENMRALGKAIQTAQEASEQAYQQGKLSNEQAIAQYQHEIDQIIKVGKAHGLTEEAIRREYGAAIDLVNITVPKKSWLDDLMQKAATAAAQLERANHAASQLSSSLPSGGTRAFSEFAEGGIVNGPTPAIVGEAGPEVIIPLSQPGRAAQLAQQSGLTAMLGSGGTPTVYVFVGNDQLETYMVKVVDRNNRAMGTAMAYGARGL